MAASLTGIDFRPLDGQLFGVAKNGLNESVVTIHPTTGVVSQVGPGMTGLQDLFYGMDFNPTVDRIRSTGDLESNRRLNPITGGLTATDVPLAYVPGDLRPGDLRAVTDPSVVHVAYDNNFPAATETTLYGIDTDRDVLVRIGGPGGNPSPNGGQLTTIGPLGVNATELGGFDIQPFTNDAYAALRVNNTSILYHINLATGAATPIGPIGNQAVIDGLTLALCTTAAAVDISGRVLTPDGLGLRNAVVSMVDSTGVVRTATTSSFGYYSFEGVDAGQAYVVGVSSRRYRFAPRVVQAFDTMTDVDFVGLE